MLELLSKPYLAVIFFLAQVKRRVVGGVKRLFAIAALAVCCKPPQERGWL